MPAGGRRDVSLSRPRGQFQVLQNSAHPTGCRQIHQHPAHASTAASNDLAQMHARGQGLTRSLLQAGEFAARACENAEKRHCALLPEFPFE
ncbi:hypothetical protein Q664_38530 [Archangium violaceum Cb vi76]|uniref:Uncharacterized protein n=1 Tax=Archangium violaceum Cb vi76 TaxID=1406225 RepID=A0A084SK25_9BACT|nr:hypothetical protein Q664_38530 [Archangium violaceum Cb vi76]